MTTLAACAPATSCAEGLLAPCEYCDLLIGAGTTFSHFAWTDGLVSAGTLELDESRWELGVFRFATAQSIPISAVPADYHAANPYWGFTAIRRWQVLHRGRGKLYLGFGANYRTEIDYLEATNWNSPTCSRRASILVSTAAWSSWAFATGRTHGSDRETAVRTSSR